MLPLGGSIVVPLLVVGRGVCLLASTQPTDICPPLPLTRRAAEACQTNDGTREGVVRADAQVHAPQQRGNSAEAGSTLSDCFQEGFSGSCLQRQL